MYKRRLCETDVTNFTAMKRLLARKYNVFSINGIVDNILVWCGETRIVINNVEYKFQSEEILSRFRRYINVGDNIEITYLVDQYGITRIACIVNHNKATEYVSVRNNCVLQCIERKTISQIINIK